jgi:hypothetical protein
MALVVNNNKSPTGQMIHVPCGTHISLGKSFSASAVKVYRFDLIYPLNFDECSTTMVMKRGEPVVLGSHPSLFGSNPNQFESAALLVPAYQFQMTRHTHDLFDSAT